MLSHLPRHLRFGVAASPETQTERHSVHSLSGRDRLRCLALYGHGVLCLLAAALGVFFIFCNALWPADHYRIAGVPHPMLSGAMFLFMAMLVAAALSFFLFGQGLLSLERARRLQTPDEPETQPGARENSIITTGDTRNDRP